MTINTTSAPGGATSASPSLRGPLAFAIACFIVWGLAYGLLDVLRMLALGADSVLLGRAWAFALAAAGEAGVTRVLELIAAEMQVAMTLTGVTNIQQISRDLIDRHA